MASATRDTLHPTPQRTPGRRIAEVDGWPVLEQVEGQLTTDPDIQRWRDADQR